MVLNDLFNYVNDLFKSVGLSPSKLSHLGQVNMNMKKVGIFGAAGVLLAVLVIGGILASGIRLPGFPSNQGTLIIKLTDAPVELEHLNVTFAELEVHKAEYESEEGEWISLHFVDEDMTSFYVDILSLQGVSQDMSVEEILQGNYTMIRMTILGANATYSDGSDVDPLIVPPGHIDVKVHFEIEAGFETVLLVDMTAHISETNRLSPVLNATVVTGPP
jgi:hypothetical protein